jgi:NADPH-dependent 2,4-dienoyl-CoA reductase/sulfur reductase-like enzyme
MRLLVIGGSDAGIAASLHARELDSSAEVTVVVADAFPNFSICGLPYYLSGDVADWRALTHRTAGDLEAAGLELRLEHTARAIDPTRRQVTVTDPGGTDNQLSYDRLVVAGEPDFTAAADLVLVVVGVRPDTELAVAAGLATGVRGALKVDRRMRTNLPNVLAAGDCVETWHRLLGRPAYLPLGTTAHKQGRIAGETAVGGGREFAGSLGTQVVKVFELAVARTGRRDTDAREGGFDPVTVGSVQFAHKAYYPGAHQLHIHLTGDRTSGQLLGAQLVGRHDAEVAKRIDIPAGALFHGVTVAALSDLDLSYTPPFGSPWDAIQLAAHDWVRQATAPPA